MRSLIIIICSWQTWRLTYKSQALFDLKMSSFLNLLPLSNCDLNFDSNSTLRDRSEISPDERNGFVFGKQRNLLQLADLSTA